MILFFAATPSSFWGFDSMKLKVIYLRDSINNESCLKAKMFHSWLPVMLSDTPKWLLIEYKYINIQP